MSDIVQWCIRCGARFAGAEIVDCTACPKCGESGIPCDPKFDVSVRINWHELRILTLWAERWAEKFTGETAKSRKSLYAIAGRLERQFPDFTPLTFGGEIRQVRRAYGPVETNLPKGELVEVHGPGAVVERNEP